MSVLKGVPEAIGLVRSEDPWKYPLDDLRWGCVVATMKAGNGSTSIV